MAGPPHADRAWSKVQIADFRYETAICRASLCAAKAGLSWALPVPAILGATREEHRSSATRRAGPDEYVGLRKIEFEADRLFASVGIGPFANDDAEDHFGQSVLVLVVGEPPVGFVCVELVDGNPHIWQLSVDPEQARKGLGRTLVRAVCEWAKEEGFEAITLTTYRDVPWNGPFYESLGFVTLDALAPGLQAIREHERAIGDDDFGPRVAMRLAI